MGEMLEKDSRGIAIGRRCPNQLRMVRFYLDTFTVDFLACLGGKRSTGTSMVLFTTSSLTYTLIPTDFLFLHSGQRVKPDLFNAYLVRS